MGGRGTSGTRNKVDEMNVPFDEWGERWLSHDHYVEGDGYNFDIQDEIVGNSERQEEEIDKKTAIGFVKDFWYAPDREWTEELDSGDVAIYLAYADGTVRDVVDDVIEKKDGTFYRKAPNFTNLVGVYVSTPWDEVSWGGEYAIRNGQKVFQQFGVHDEDGNEHEGNFHSYYKTTEEWIQRIKTTYSPQGTKREVIRKSTKRKTNY